MSRRSLISNLIAEQLAAANSATSPAPAAAVQSPAAPESAPAGPEPHAARRVAAGPVRTMGLTLERLELERKSLADALAGGGGVVELDPALVDASFARDRFGEPNDEGLAALQASIAEHGQEVPILVRAAPGRPGRFQAAYGHRRLAACRALGRPVKALVRELSDPELVVAQGLENAERVDLSFIEKAAFARSLEDGGFARPTIMAALSTDKTELSKLIAVARGVPDAIIRAIGPAPKAGRRRWLSLAESLSQAGALARIEALLDQERFRAADSDARFGMALAHAQRSEADIALAAPQRLTIAALDGRPLARITETDERLTLQIDRADDPAFADFLVRELPHLHARFLAEGEPARRKG
jgi:ParB family chromosome partitioning protein